MDRTRALRFARHVAVPEVGPVGQERIGAATVVIAGDDLLAETAARYLAAAGAGTVRLLARGGPSAALEAALRASSPEVRVEHRAWPEGGEAWVLALRGAAVAVRSGFDDDPMLRAAVRTGVPVVVARGRDEAVEVVAFRRHGPCPHVPLEIPERVPVGTGRDGPGAVVGGVLAAAEALHIVVGTERAARARMLALPLDGGDATSQDLPWSPECFACGGSGAEMEIAWT